MNAKVHRDDWGVPHLRAGDPLALAYLQGVNAAADRGWQIELERRRFLGTSAAFLGQEAVGWDTFARQARIDDTAQRCYQNLDDDTREWISAYVDGVNHALPSAAVRAPEFASTGLEPTEWEPWAPLGIWMAVHILFAGFPTLLWREQVVRHLGDPAVTLFNSEGPTTAGSNGWLIPGDLTATGLPIIAGDPHRYIESPNVYQQIRLSCPEYDAVGLAVPGIPGIAHFGHNGEVAWGITNAMASYQDLYYEQVRRSDSQVEALGSSGWQTASVHTETIEVAGSDPVQIEVIESERGPIIVGGPDEDRAISLRYPPRVTGRLGFETIPALLKATTVADVDRAWDTWVEPVNVVMAADTSGGLLHRTAGLVPERDPGNLLRVVPAWQAEHEWRGWHELPRATVDGVAVMANSREIAEPLGEEFAAPHRYQRIKELLTSRSGWAVEEMPTIHTDTYLGSADLLLDLLAGLPFLTPAAAELRAQLQVWDRRMDASSTIASSFAAIRKALIRRIAEHPTLAPLDQESGCPEVFQPWMDTLTHVAFALENLLTTDLLPSVDLESLAREAVEEVAGRLEPRGPWGDTHQLSPLHALRGPLFAPDEEPIDLGLSGDHHCVMSTSPLPGLTDVCIRASAARFAWDLAKRENSSWIVPLGASGVLGDPHHHDQLPLWLRGELAPIVTDWDKLTPEADTFDQDIAGLGRVRIVPARPADDMDLIYDWVTAERARFWGMGDKSRAEVLAIYEFLDSLPTHHVYLVHVDDVPVALFQTYDPGADPVGEAYDVKPGDIGVHLLIAPGDPRPGFTGQLFVALGTFLISQKGHPRIVVEPDARNAKAVTRFQRGGFTMGHEVTITQHDGTTKPAQLGFLTREAFLGQD